MDLALNNLQRLICHKTQPNPTLTFLAAKVYNARLLNCIEPEIEKILRKNQNTFREIDPQHHRF